MRRHRGPASARHPGVARSRQPVVLLEVPAGAVAPKLEPVIVIVGEATPGPGVPLNDTEEMLGRGAGVGAALAAGAAAAGWLIVMAGSFSFRAGAGLGPAGGWLMPVAVGA